MAGKTSGRQSVGDRVHHGVVVGDRHSPLAEGIVVIPFDDMAVFIADRCNRIEMIPMQVMDIGKGPFFVVNHRRYPTFDRHMVFVADARPFFDLLVKLTHEDRGPGLQASIKVSEGLNVSIKVSEGLNITEHKGVGGIKYY